MKHQSAKAFVIVCCFQLLLFSTSFSQTPTCVTVQNFTSVCVQQTQPRKFTLNFKLVASSPGNSVVLVPLVLGSNFNNQPAGVTFSLVNNQANVNITYTEGGMLSGIIKFKIELKNNNNLVCETTSEQMLVSCGNYPCLYGVISTQPNVGFNVGSLANYTLPTFTIHYGIQAQPKKVSKITTTITSSKRRTKCLNAPAGAWAILHLPPLTAAQLGIPTAQLTTFATSVTKIHTPTLSYQLPMDYAAVFAIPTTKINPNCPEEYTLTFTTTILFEDGCPKTDTFTVTKIRP